MNNPQKIALDDVVLREDLDPRLGEREDDLIAQYADIFDALPPIEINQKNELIDGWHRVRAAKRAKRSEITYVVVETESDDDLGDKMWSANLQHGVQYTRVQRQTQGLKLHGRGLKAKEIAQRVGVSISSVYSWTKELRERERQARDAEIARLHEEGMTQQEIADEVGIERSTVSKNVKDSRTEKIHKVSEIQAEPAIEPLKAETLEELEAAEPKILESDETLAEEEVEISEPDPQPGTDETSAAEEEASPSEPEAEARPPEPIPDDILSTARAVMRTFSETRPDDYVARLEASPSEWMTITDDSLSNELERQLLTSAAAICLWQEWMIWYRGGRTSAFTDAFGKIGTVFVRGQAGQWRIVSRLRSILKRLRI